MKQRLHLTILAAMLALMTWANGEEIDGIFYELDNDAKTASVTYNSYNSYTGSITIPKSITYSDITYSVISIGNSAFYNCTGLTNINIPNSVTSIGSWAFYNCTGLTSVNINSNAIVSNTSSNNNLRGIFGNQVKEYIIGENVTSIGDYAFDNCDSLINVTIPNSVTSIGNHAFYHCSGLTSITIPNSVTKVKSDAFLRCDSLKRVNITDLTAWCKIRFEDAYAQPLLFANHLYLNGEEVKDLVIPESVTTIGRYAFDGCAYLTSVTIPKSVISIGELAFSDCVGLTKVNISDLSDWCKINFEDISASPLCEAKHLYLNGQELTDLTIPSSITDIKDYAFYNCISLTSISIPSSVTSIGTSAFNGCDSLKRVNISSLAAWCNINFANSSSQPLYYAKHLYYNGNEVTNLTIPSSVTNISKYTFSYCEGLTNVTIPNTVTGIGDYAFNSCSKLTTLNIGNSVSNIGAGAFTSCSNLTRLNITDLAAWCKINFVDRFSQPLWYAKHLYHNSKEVKELIIPNSVTNIGKLAFAYCEGLTNITIPNSVTKIGEDAFEYCKNLTSINIPNSVISIEEGAFSCCDKLSKITIPESVTYIGSCAFAYCDSLSSVTVERTDAAAYNCSYDTFNGLTLSSIILNVPMGSESAYAAEMPWAFFFTDERTNVTIDNLEYTLVGNKAIVSDWNNALNRNSSFDYILVPEKVAYNNKDYTVTVIDIKNNSKTRNIYAYCWVIPATVKEIASIGNRTYYTMCIWYKGTELSSISQTLGITTVYLPDETYEANKSAWEDNVYKVLPYSDALETSYTYDEENKTATCTLGSFRLNKRSYNNDRENAILNNAKEIGIVIDEITIPGVRVRDGEQYTVTKLTSSNDFRAPIRTIKIEEGVQELGRLSPGLPNREDSLVFQPNFLEEVYLPSTLRTIGGWAFQCCTNLKRVHMQEGLDSIAPGVFTYCFNLESLNLPASLRVFEEGQSWLKSCTEVTIPEENPYITVKDGVIFNKEMTTLLQYPAAREDESYRIPDGVKTIQAWAFEGSSKLKTLIVPSSIEYMDNACLIYTRPEAIRMESSTPPQSGDVFAEYRQTYANTWLYPEFNYRKEVTLYVPKGSKEAYKNAYDWKDFENIVEDEELTAIGDAPTIDKTATNGNAATPVAYYNLQGQRIVKPQSGQLVIVRYSDGTSRKMLVK